MSTFTPQSIHIPELLSEIFSHLDFSSSEDLLTLTKCSRVSHICYDIVIRMIMQNLQIEDKEYLQVLEETCGPGVFHFLTSDVFFLSCNDLFLIIMRHPNIARHVKALTLRFSPQPTLSLEKEKKFWTHLPRLLASLPNLRSLTIVDFPISFIPTTIYKAVRAVILRPSCSKITVSSSPSRGSRFLNPELFSMPSDTTLLQRRTTVWDEAMLCRILLNNCLHLKDISAHLQLTGTMISARSVPQKWSHILSQPPAAPTSLHVNSYAAYHMSLFDLHLVRTLSVTIFGSMNCVYIIANQTKVLESLYIKTTEPPSTAAGSLTSVPPELGTYPDQCIFSRLKLIGYTWNAEDVRPCNFKSCGEGIDVICELLGKTELRNGSTRHLELNLHFKANTDVWKKMQWGSLNHLLSRTADPRHVTSCGLNITFGCKTRQPAIVEKRVSDKLIAIFHDVARGLLQLRCRVVNDVSPTGITCSDAKSKAIKQIIIGDISCRE